MCVREEPYLLNPVPQASIWQLAACIKTDTPPTGSTVQSALCSRRVQSFHEHTDFSSNINAMFKLFVSLAVLCFLTTCFGQTFQYSHGWTSGKRALNTHRENDISETLQQDGERKLERCLMQLQYLLHNPLSLRAGVQALTPTAANLFGNHHQSNELYEELNAADANDYGKH